MASALSLRLSRIQTNRRGKCHMIDYEVRDHVAEIMVNHPPVNAIPLAFMDALIAAVFAAKSPELMKLGKDAFVRATANGYREGAAGAVDLISTVFGTDACKEGPTAFVEKRKPVWQQR